MKIKIYQIYLDRDSLRLAFCNSNQFQKYMNTKKFVVDPSIYDMTYEGNLNCKYLEDVWCKLNNDHPADYKTRSLSVSDVVEIVESDELVPGFYFCDSFGFKRINFQGKEN